MVCSRNNCLKMKMRMKVKKQHPISKNYKITRNENKIKNKNSIFDNLFVSLNENRSSLYTSSGPSTLSTLSPISNSFPQASVSPVKEQQILNEKIEQIKKELVPQVDHAHKEEDCQSLQWRKPSILRLNRVFRKKISCSRPQFCYRSRIRHNRSPIFLRKSLRTVLSRMTLTSHDKLCVTCFDDHWKRMQCNPFNKNKKRKSVIPRYYNCNENVSKQIPTKMNNNTKQGNSQKSFFINVSNFDDKNQSANSSLVKNCRNCMDTSMLFNHAEQSKRHLGSTFVGSCRRSRRLIEKCF